MSNIISKLQVTTTEKDNEGQNIREFIPIGAYSDYVIISDGNSKFSLTSLYNYLKSFFNNKMFSWYGYNIPINNDQIIDFYQIEENDNN